MREEKVFSYDLADIYPLYIQKAQRKNRAKAEVDEIISWLTAKGKAMDKILRKG